jgi:hypothetical protein
LGVGTPIDSIAFTITARRVNVPLDANGRAAYLTGAWLVGTQSNIGQYSGADHEGNWLASIVEIAG